DVPCLALNLAAVAVFLRARDRGSWTMPAVAGILAGLAMQTKYTALTVPAAFIAAVASSPPDRRGLAFRQGVLAVGTAAAVFLSWEVFTAWRYGQSHFLHHLARHGTEWAKKLNFVGPFVALVGGVGAPVGLVGMVAWRVPALWVISSAVAFAGGLLLLGCAAIPPADVALGATVFGASGITTLSLLAGTAGAFAVRRGPGRLRRDGLFLAVWRLIEVA